MNKRLGTILFLTYLSAVILGQMTIVNFALTESGAISGTVTDVYGNPVYNARVNANGPSSGYNFTDVNGTYFISELQAGTYSVRVTPPYDNLFENSAIAEVIEGEVTIVNIVLQVGGIIDITVKDYSGAPIYSAYVYTFSGPSYGEGYTDVNGTFKIKRLLSGTYTVTAIPPYDLNLLENSTIVNVSLGEVTVANITLPKGGMISGFVTDVNGIPVYDAYVSVSGPSYSYDYTDVNGSYTIIALQAGDYTITAYPPSGLNLLENSTSLEVTTEETTILTIILPQGGILAGFVKLLDETPVEGTKISVEGPIYNYDYTDVDGSYEFIALKPGGYFVSAWYVGYVPSYGAVNVTAGETTIANFTIIKGANITGTVTDVYGTPVVDAYVEVTSDSYMISFAYTNSSGGYLITTLGFGSYTVAAYPPYGLDLTENSTSVEIVAEETLIVNIVLPRGGIITGTVTLYGTPVEDALVEVIGLVYDYNYSNAAGLYEITGLKTGNYTVNIYLPPYYYLNASIIINVSAGETVVADFAFPIVHDIAVINVAFSKSVVGQGCTMFINVTLENQGNQTETFDVTVYANATTIATLTKIALTSGNSTTIIFEWNTTGFAQGDYTISAVASNVTGEIDTADDTFFDGTVRVNMRGDITGDDAVDVFDLVIAATSFGASFGQTSYNPNADINNDNIVDEYDLIMIAAEISETGP